GRRMGPRARRAALGAAIGVGLAVAGAWLAWDGRYRTAAELDERPYPLRRVELVPPEADRGVELFGKARLRVLIGRDGAVDRVEVVESALHARLLDHAVQAFAATRWSPGRRGGRDV